VELLGVFDVVYFNNGGVEVSLGVLLKSSGKIEDDTGFFFDNLGDFD